MNVKSNYQKKFMKCNLQFITFVTFFCLLLGMSIEVKGNPKQSSVTIKGLVLDELNIPIIGANITEKGTLNGTISDVDGNFVLQVNNENAVLVVSYIGYRTVEQGVFAGQQMKIVLSEDTRMMDEVVVIGYGTQKRTDVTSSVSSVKSESFNKGAVLDAGQLVQGKVAGLQISLPTGDPTASTSVMLRGTSTLMGSTHPLILVDGVPGSFSTVAPEDIESIDVLKDGSATAIYGTRGTNGVIIITTKGGRRNMPTTLEYNGYVSISKQARTADFMNADDLRQRWNEGFEFSGANDQDYGHNTDWLGEVSRTGVSNVHNLTLRGGGAQSSTIATLTYDERQGTFKKSDSRNIRGRLEYIHRMFDDRLTANVSFIANERTTGAGFNSSVYRYATIQNPTQPIYDEQGEYVERPVYFYDNPVSILNETEGMTRSRNLRFTGSVEFRPIENLAIKGMYTKRGQSYLNGYYYTKKHPNTTEGGYNGYASRYTSDYLNDLAEFTVDWNIALEKHRIGVIAGYNYEASSSENFGVNNRDFPTDSYTYNKLESGMALSRGEAAMNSYKESEKLIGLFSRVTYNYDDRYLLMASIRREGSSKFGADHKWGNFPGISAGWRVNEEEFMEEYSWLDNLKLRAGYGITGINIGSPYVSLASLNYQNYFMYSGEWINTLIPVRNPNPNLKWEKKYEYNIGLDFDMFDGRFGGAFDFYRRDTKDALWNYSVPVPPYQYGTITANVGQIRNTGLEILFNGTPVKLPSIEWNSNISFSTNTNELVSIANDQFQMTSDWFTTGHTGEPIQTTTHRVKVGDPIGNFFGLKSVGFTQDGLWVVERLNLDEEGNIIDKYYGLGGEAELEDRQVLGNGVPKYYLNWNNQLQYKRFDLSISMRGAFGFEILNFQKMYYGNPTIQYNVLNAAFDLHDVVDMTTGEKTGEKVTINDSQRYVSEYVENGNYWKIDNVTLGYTFDLRRVDFINNLRFYVSCLNLATFTGYSGIDPEVRMTGLDAGIDHRDKYPTNRSFTFGVNISF